MLFWLIGNPCIRDSLINYSSQFFSSIGIFAVLPRLCSFRRHSLRKISCLFARITSYAFVDANKDVSIFNFRFVAILQHLHNEEPPHFMFIYLTTFILNSHLHGLHYDEWHISFSQHRGQQNIPWKWKAKFCFFLSFSVATKPINRSNEYYVFACTTRNIYFLPFGIRIKMHRERSLCLGSILFFSPIFFSCFFYSALFFWL